MILIADSVELVDGLKHTPINDAAPLAPVMLYDSAPEYRGIPAYIWHVVRCPYCGDVHDHGGGDDGEDPHRYLGGRIAHCHPEVARWQHDGTPIDREAEYRLVAIEGNPTREELDTHFPMVQGPLNIQRLAVDRPQASRRYISSGERADVWEKSHGYCWYCGDRLNPFRNFTIDHVTPVADGGGDNPSNLVPCCRTCNSAKGVMALEVFRRRRGGGLFWFEASRGRS